MSGRGQQGGAGPGAIVTGRGGGSYTFENITWQNSLAAIWWFTVVWLGIRGGWCFLVWVITMCVGPQAGGILAFGVAVAYSGFGTKNVRLKPNKYTPIFLALAMFLIFLGAFDYFPTALQWSWIEHQMYYKIATVEVSVGLLLIGLALMIIGAWVTLYKVTESAKVSMAATFVLMIAIAVTWMTSGWPGPGNVLIVWEDAGWIAAESSAVILRFFGGIVMLILAWIPAQQMDTALRTEVWLPGLRESAKTVPATAESVPAVGGWGLTSASRAARTEVEEGPDIDYIPPMQKRGNA